MRELVLIQRGRVVVGDSPAGQFRKPVATDPLSGKVLAINVTMNVVK